MASFTRNILDFYKYNDKTSWYLEKLFTNTDNVGYYKAFEQDPIQTNWNGKDPYIGTIDEVNSYSINGLGFRGEAYEDPDALASGCSITFGIGIPEAGRWTNILGEKKNKKVLNVGSPGASVESICTNIIHYCLNNKVPKEVFCLFPDFFRRMVVADKDFYKTKRNTWAEGKNYLEYVFCSPSLKIYDSSSIFLEIEDKKYIEDSVSPHQLILNSVNAIYALEAFCSSNNISLYWTTWDLATDSIMQELSKLKGFKLKNFTPFFPPHCSKEIGWLVSSSCKSDHNSYLKNNPAWHVGTDYAIVNKKKITTVAHPGIHVQQHVADLFYNLSSKD